MGRKALFYLIATDCCTKKILLLRRKPLISYESLWNTMKLRGITTYALINKYGINPHTIHNLRHNQSITMFTLERLCMILNCDPNDVISFKDDPK